MLSFRSCGWSIGTILLAFGQVPWMQWGIYADSTGNGLFPVHETSRCRDTFWLIVDTAGMGAGGITGWRWYIRSNAAAQIVFAPSMDPSTLPVLFPSAGMPDPKIGIEPLSMHTYTFQLVVYFTSGDSASSHKSFQIRSYPPLSFEKPANKEVVCPSSLVAFQLNVIQADSFYVQYGPNASDTVKNRSSFVLSAPSSLGTWSLYGYTYACGNRSGPVVLNLYVGPSAILPFMVSVFPQGVCPGDSVTISVSETDQATLRGTTSQSWMIRDPSGTIVHTANTLPFTWRVPPGTQAGVYSLEVTLQYPCGSFINYYSSAIRVYGNGSLSPSTLNYPPSAYCLGTPTSLEVNAAGEVNWDVGNDGTWDYLGAKRIIHTFSSIPPGGVPIKIKQDVGCESREDVLYFNPSVTNANPNGAIVLARDPLCPGGPVSVKGNLMRNYNAISWDLSWIAGLVDGIRSDTTFFLPNIPGSYTITPILRGCASSSLTPISFSVPASTPPFIPTPRVFGTPCLLTGGVVYITNETGPALVDSVTYLLPDGSVHRRGWTDTLAYAIPPGVASTAVLALYNFGCMRVVKPIPIEATDQRALIRAVGFSASTLCPGGYVTWSMNGHLVQQVDIYLLPNTTTPILSKPFSNLSVNESMAVPASPGDYTYMFIARGCGGNDTAYATLLVRSDGEVAYFTGPGSACVGRPVTFVRTGSSMGVRQVSWYFGDGASLSSPQNPIQYLYVDPGSYPVTLTIESIHCGSSTYLRYVKVYRDAAWLGGLQVIPAGSVISYSVEAVGYDSVRWDFGDGNSAYGLRGVHTYQANGTYVVRVVAYNPCGNDTLSTVVSMTTVEVGRTATSAVEGWEVFPNPALEEVILRHKWYGGAARVQVRDMYGRVVWEERLAQVPARLFLGGLPAGLYVLRVVSAEGVAVLRLMVE